ncbi:Ni/Fe hydrogenase subunit alpha [Candidatus Woesearchaeota archaeon]|nr:Ni/Fe hydrogenase subunit alpha [Candidatus Woesearchaeota archaeon]
MTKKITLNHITKIEGHASLTVSVKNGKVTKCELASTEGARFFEGIVLGKHFDDIREITSKICGICSVAHTIACLKAIENAFGIQVSDQTEQLRELMTIGERIRSHATHLYLLVLPDFLGFESGVEMAAKHKDKVKTALDLVKLGNNLVQVLGGKEMHPFTSIVGGFTAVPSKESLKELLKRLKDAKPFAVQTVELFANLKLPDFEKETEYLAMLNRKGFPLHYGNIVTSKGIDVPAYEYKKFISEYITDYSHSKFATRDGKAYMTGALSRMNISLKDLDDETKKIIRMYNLKFPSNNPFYNNTAQALELVHWINKAIEIIAENDFVDEGLPKVRAKAGRGVACVEAPRGMLLHDYTFDNHGNVTSCNIITPTAQNLKNMEEDIKEYLPQLLKKFKNKEKIKLEIEKLIRAYDPCFSCATHFLKIKWE